MVYTMNDLLVLSLSVVGAVVGLQNVRLPSSFSASSLLVAAEVTGFASKLNSGFCKASTAVVVATIE